MKTIKLALLGTAALAAASMTAKADELSALKAEIEALNSRMSQLEAAPAVPAGYQLLTISEATATGWDEKRSDFVGKNRTATVIGIMPTADMPATTTIEWHGQIRTALNYAEGEDWDIIANVADGVVVLETGDAVDVDVRGRLWVRAVTDTAVGEVGVRMRLETRTGIADNAEEVRMDIAWGWWQMTPELTLGGGYQASLAEIQHGMTYQATYGLTGGPSNRDTDAMRLTYASGPLSFALALEESESVSTGGAAAANNDYLAAAAPGQVIVGAAGADRGDMPAIAGALAYAGDTFSVGVNGIWQDDDGHVLVANVPDVNANAGDDDWFIGGGATYSGEMFLISAAIGAGEGYAGAYTGAEAVASDDSYWGGSIFARINVSDSAYAELGYGYSELDWLETYDGGWGSNPTYVQGGDVDTHTFNVGFYYAPVSQLTIGVQADYQVADYDLAFNSAPVPYEFETEAFTAAFVTWFSF